MMKMISSTSSTSIIGVTLMSFDSPVLPPVVIAMRFSYGLLAGAVVGNVPRHGRLGAGLLIRDGADDAHAVVRRDVDRVEHLGVVEILVRLDVENLVRGARVVDPLELIRERLVLDRLLVQIVLPERVDAEHLIFVVFRMRLQVDADGRLRLKACIDAAASRP